MHGFQAEKARKSTKSPICMTRARPRICMNFQTVFAGCQLFTRSTFCAWFAVRFLAVQRTEILLLHACCSKNLVCTCISVPFQRNFSQLVTRFFSTAANFIQLYGYSLGYWTSNHSGNQVLDLQYSTVDLGSGHFMHTHWSRSYTATRIHRACANLAIV